MIDRWHWILALILLTVVAYLTAKRWGRGAAAWIESVSLVVIILCFASLVRYSPPNSKATFSTAHGYIGISSEALMLDAYEHLRARVSAFNSASGAAAPDVTVVLYGRPEMSKMFHEHRDRMPDAKFVPIRPEPTKHEQAEGVVFEAMLRDVPQRVRSSTSGMAPDGFVTMFYPRSRKSGIEGEHAARLSALQSLLPKLKLEMVNSPDDLLVAGKFRLPNLTVECPQTVPPGLGDVTATLRLTGSASSNLEIELHTLEPKPDPAGNPITRRGFQFNSRRFTESAASTAEITPVDISWRKNIVAEFKPPSRVIGMAASTATDTQRVGSKTLVVRLFHVRDGIRENISASSHVVAAGIVPAAFLGADQGQPQEEKSKLFEGLRLADRNMVEPLGLKLTAASHDSDLQKLIKTNVGLLIVDADNFRAGGPYGADPGASYDQLKRLLSAEALSAVPTMLFVGNFDSLSITGIQKQSTSSPRKVLLFVDTSGSTQQFRAAGPAIKTRLIKEMSVRSFDESFVNVLGPYALEYELYSVFTVANSLIKDSAVSDVICLYDSINPGADDNRHVDNPVRYPGTNICDATNGARRFYRYFPAPGPRLCLVSLAVESEHFTRHNELANQKPARMLFFPQSVTLDFFDANNPKFNGLSHWIQEEIMPRLNVSMEPSTAGLPVNASAIDRFRSDLNQHGIRALVNSFCDFKTPADWKTTVGSDSEIVLWTNHWNTGKLKDELASPFLIRLPQVVLGENKSSARAYQVCIELVANITGDGSREQREKLANIFMHIINCTSAFTASPEVQVSADATGFQFRKRGSQSFGLKQADAQLMKLTGPEGELPSVNWEADLTRLDRPRIIFSDRIPKPSVFDAVIHDQDAKPALAVRAALEDSGIGVLRALSVRSVAGDSPVETNESPKVTTTSSELKLPGYMLPMVGLCLVLALGYLIKRF